MHTLITIIYACFLGFMSQCCLAAEHLNKSFEARMLTENALGQAITLGKQRFSCVIRIDVDLEAFENDYKKAVFAAALEQTFEKTLEDLKYHNKRNYDKVVEQMNKKGGKEAYLKHVLNTPHLHGPQRPKLEGGQSEWIKFPGSIETYSVDLEAFPPFIRFNGSATLIDLSDTQLLGLDNRLFVSAAHVFSHLVDYGQGRYAPVLLPCARAIIGTTDDQLKSFRISELFLPNNHKANDILFGILEEAIPGDIKPAKIKSDIFETLSDHLPQLFWQCGFPVRIRIDPLAEVRSTAATANLKSYSCNSRTEANIVAGQTIVNSYNSAERILISDYAQEIYRDKASTETPDNDTVARKMRLLRNAPLVYLYHNVLPKEMTLVHPDSKIADLYMFLNEEDFLTQLPDSLTYSDDEGVISKEGLYQLFDNLRKKPTTSVWFHATKITGKNEQLYFTMSFFTNLPDHILFSGSGMSGGGVFASDNNSEIVAVITSAKRFTYTPIKTQLTNIYQGTLSEQSIVVWPFFQEFLHECENNIVGSKFVHITSDRTLLFDH